MKYIIMLGAFLCWNTAISQAITNTVCTDPIAEQVMKGQYDPSEFAATNILNDHEVILCALRTAISADSLRAHLEKLVSFHNRNTFSDTVSQTIGIGAARRWAFAKFQEFSAANENRLIPAYLQFDYSDPDCGDLIGTKNVLAVLPGSDPSNPSIVLIEAHMDSRCADNCDPNCIAEGADDNGSGSALVIELARVLSRYTFDHTLVFMLTTGEEHGLVGATAMARWCTEQSIAIKGVQNNDIVGGIWCGTTSSDPGCEVEGIADSTQVRIFSVGSATKTHRGFARTIKIYYEEKLRSQVPVPMDISIMNQEDRDNRGGDHIPFREEGFRSVRFTSANEHGDANVSDSTYHDRQHTSADILGVDTDSDQAVDSFYVDFNYLQRNTVINGMTTVLMALGPEPPSFVVNDEPAGLRLDIAPTPDLMEWRVGVRHGSGSTQFEAMYRTNSTSFTIPGLNGGTPYWVSVAGIDSARIMSPFSTEIVRTNDADTPLGNIDDLPYGLACSPIGITEISQSQGPFVSITCNPNPFSEETTIQIELTDPRINLQAFILVRDLYGREVARLPINAHSGANSIRYTHGSAAGIYSVTMIADNVQLGTTTMMAFGLSKN